MTNASNLPTSIFALKNKCTRNWKATGFLYILYILSSEFYELYSLFMMARDTDTFNLWITIHSVG